LFRLLSIIRNGDLGHFDLGGVMIEPASIIIARYFRRDAPQSRFHANFDAPRKFLAESTGDL
jgi:hypothetical protein